MLRYFFMTKIINNNKNWCATLLCVSLVSFFLCVGITGCQKVTYPEEKVTSAVKEICSKEYHIEDVEVKFSGKTIGVFLPLQRLFTTDVRKVILSGEATDLESLFAPLPEAMEQVENVLFAISRVILSTDKSIDFYQLFATDVTSTGLQLVLTGYIPDVRRVRLWDISRNEYRKRIMHELKLNRSVLWQKPVRELLRDAGTITNDELVTRFFGKPPTPEIISPLFYGFLSGLPQKQNLKISIREIKSHPYKDNQALVYVRFVETYDPKPGVSRTAFSYPSGTELEYIFIVNLFEDGFKIIQVIPFYYLDETGKLKKISFPPELDLYKNLESWSGRFEVENVNLGEFLAHQLDRRVKELLFGDERIRNTIRQAQINFIYRYKTEELDGRHPKPYFALHFDFETKEMKRIPETLSQMISNEDVLYVLNLILREFVDVVRSYQFRDYSHFELVWDVGTSASSLVLNAERLELFRKKKLDVATLLGRPFQPFPPS